MSARAVQCLLVERLYLTVRTETLRTVTVGYTVHTNNKVTLKSRKQLITNEHLCKLGRYIDERLEMVTARPRCITKCMPLSGGSSDLKTDLEVKTTESEDGDDDNDDDGETLTSF